DGDALQRHANFLLEEVTTYDYDGLDLNYESIYLKDKKAFFTLVETLSEGLKKNSKMLSITVLSKWGDDIDYSFAPQTREVQNYKELEPYADQLRIMTYDFTSQGSDTSGPIAPEEWVREVLDYTKGTGIAINKVVLGVHMYGYSWPENNRAKALDYRIVHILQKTNETTQTNYDPESNEATIRYIKEGVPHSGYYASPEVIKARLNIAVEYGLQGVSFWRLGDDQL
ncbi:MAG: glycosyl hydrolase family 18 protein, partial [Candidatus Dojkabacteria bacterium]